MKRKARMNRFIINIGTLILLTPILTMYDGNPATELRIQAADFLPEVNIMVNEIKPVIGTHIGPSAFGFAVIGTNE
jgi:hypothetical protein